MNQLSEGPTQVCFPAYFLVLIGNVGVLRICLCFHRQRWTPRLCNGFLWLMALVLLRVTVAPVLFSPETGPRQEAGFPWGLVVMGSIPVVFEFIFLVLV